MSLTSIVIILQLVLTLLSNPATAQNPQVQALATQAINEATQALASIQSPVQTASPTVSSPIPTSPTPSQNTPVAPTSPSTTNVVTSSALSTSSGTCQLKIQNVTENNANIVQGNMTISKYGGSNNDVSLYAALPNGSGYLSSSTQWIKIMDPVLVIDPVVNEQFNYQYMGGLNLSHTTGYATTTVTVPLWFKASSPDGTACYDIEQVTILPLPFPFSIQLNPNDAGGMVAPNTSNVRIGSFTFTALGQEGAVINSLNFQVNNPYFKNLRVVVDGIQIGQTIGAVNSSANYTYGDRSFAVRMSGTVVDVYADLLPTAIGTIPSATTLNGCSGYGSISTDPVSCQGPIAGQSLTVASQ